MTHGGHAVVAAERVEARAAEIADALPLRGPDGGPPVHDLAAVELLARALCRLDDVTTWLEAHGLFSGEDLRPAVDLERRLRREAAEYLDTLGLTPAARARLGVDLARSFDLAQEMAKLADAESHG